MKTLAFSLLTLFSVTIAQAGQLSATIQWAEISTLSSPLTGRIASIKAEVGDIVERNALLAELDTRPLHAERIRAKAEVKRYESQLKIAERELRHAEALYEQTVLSTTKLEDAQVRFDVTTASLEAARANLKKVLLDIEYSQLRAPFDGLIVDRQIHRGETVVNHCNATPMLKIASIKSLLAVANITPQQAQQLEPRQKVSVTTSDQRTFEGRVRSIASREDNPSLLELAVVFNSDGELMPGDRVTIITDQ